MSSRKVRIFWETPGAMNTIEKEMRMNIEIDAYEYGNIDAYKEEYVHTSREIDTDYGNTDAYEYGNIHVYE